MLIVREDIIGLGMPYRPEIEIRILFTQFTDCSGNVYNEDGSFWFQTG